MRDINETRDYEVCLAWKSRLGKTAVSSFEVKFVGSIPDKPDGIVVKIKRFINGGIGNRVENVNDLPNLMKQEVLRLIQQNINIHKETLFDDEVNWIKNPSIFKDDDKCEI